MLKEIRDTSKHSAIYALGNIATKVIGIILIPLYTNPEYLSQANFGALAILEASAQLLTGVFALAMTSSLQRWYWDEQYVDQQKRIFFSALFLVLIVNIPLFFLMGLGAGSLSLLIFDSESYTYLIRLTILTAGMRILSNQVLLVVRLRNMSLFYILVQVSKLSIVLGLVIWFVVGRGMGLEGIWEATAIGEAVILLVLLPFTLRHIEWKVNFSALREMLKYGLPLMLSTASILILTVTDRYMLKFLAGLEATAVYAIGLRLANTLGMVITASLTSALMPLRMKMINRKDNHRFFAKALLYSSYVFVLGFLALSLFSLEVLKVFTVDTNYWAATSIIPVLSMALLFTLMRLNVNIGLIIEKRTKLIAVFMFLTTLLNLGLNYFLIPLWDIYGASLATLLSQFLLFLSIYLTSQKAYPIPYEWRKIVLLVVLLVIFVGIGLAIASVPPLLRIPLKLFLLVSFPFALLPLGFYESAEKEVLRNVFRSWKDPRKLGANLKRLISPEE